VQPAAAASTASCGEAYSPHRAPSGLMSEMRETISSPNRTPSSSPTCRTSEGLSFDGCLGPSRGDFKARPLRGVDGPLGESPLGESPLGESPLGESPLGESRFSMAVSREFWV
jgi:hypothetical protein